MTMRIGMSLSGGGVRAAVFHLGVLARLADQQLLEEVTFLSTVSGGSLAVGVVFKMSSDNWPSSPIYRETTLPQLKSLLTTVDLQAAYVWRILLTPWKLLHGRASVLSASMEDKWGISGLVSELPENPRWILNTTCYETGKNFRFMRNRMGDYRTHYVLDPAFPLAEAMAASAAYPGVIGPLSFRTRDYQWSKLPGRSDGPPDPVEPAYDKLHLWDGGVYDNLGVESLFKPVDGLRDGVDFLMVSDASAALKPESSRFHAPVHLVRIAMDQVRGVRSRTVVSHLIRNPGSGAYLRIGNTAKEIFDRARVSPPEAWNEETAMTKRDVSRAAGVETTLRKLTTEEFCLLVRHGYEVADATLVAYVPSRFSHIQWRPLVAGN